MGRTLPAYYLHWGRRIGLTAAKMIAEELMQGFEEMYFKWGFAIVIIAGVLLIGRAKTKKFILRKRE